MNDLRTAAAGTGERPVRRQARGDARAAAMLEAAADVFIEKGYAAASLDDVLAKSGGSRRMIYERFGGKEGLFEAAVDALIGRVVARLSRLEIAELPPEEALRLAGRVFLEALLEPKTVALFRVVVGEARRFAGLGAAFFEAGPAAVYAIVERYLEEQTERGRLEVEDPAVAARMFIEMVKGSIHTRAILCPGETASDREIAAQVGRATTTFLHGVASRR